MTFLAVLPSIWPPFTRACLGGMAPEFRDHCVVIENEPMNRGVAASWNAIARRVIAEEIDWLVSVSAATRWGPSGGKDFIAAMDDASSYAWVLESAMPVGWHCIAWSRERVLEPVGLFDENFWPAYGEDMDMSCRILIAMKGNGKVKSGERKGASLWDCVETDATLELVNHGCRLAGIQPDFVANERYLAAKWGPRDTSKPSGYEFEIPFASVPSLAFWPEPPDDRCNPHGGWWMRG